MDRRIAWGTCRVLVNIMTSQCCQRACNLCGRLSDVSLFPLYAFCCWIFSTATARKKKKDFCRFNLTGKIDYCHYCHLYNFSHKSLFKLSDWNPHHPWGEVSFRLDIWGIFTPVQPRLYWGSPSVSSQRPVSSLLETDLGTVIKLLSIKVLIQNNCSFFSIFHVMWPNRFCFHKNI